MPIFLAPLSMERGPVTSKAQRSIVLETSVKPSSSPDTSELVKSSHFLASSGVHVELYSSKLSVSDVPGEVPTVPPIRLDVRKLALKANELVTQLWGHLSIKCLGDRM